MGQFIARIKAEHAVRRIFFLALAIVFGVLYDLLFWKQSLGLNGAVLVVFFISGFYAIAWLGGLIQRRWPIVLAVPALLLAAASAIFSNEFVGVLAPIGMILIIFAMIIAITVRGHGNTNFSFKQIPLLRSIDLPFAEWGNVLTDALAWPWKKRGEVYKKIMFGLLAALPLVIIFAALFFAADAVFAEGLRRLFNIDIGIDIIWRIFRASAIALFIAGMLYVISSENHRLIEKILLPRKIDAVSGGVVLGLINALFLVFVFIQVRYLFGNADFVLANGLTFAEYARKGFFELVAVAVLGIIVVFTVWRSHVVYRQHRLVDIFGILLLLQIGVVAASALTRMNLYQEVYGFTVLRLYVEWFIYFIGAVLGLGIVCIAVRLSFRQAAYSLLVGGVSAFTMVSLINVDLAIAKENFNRFTKDNKKIDLNYIGLLSPDTLPAMRELAQSSGVQKLTIDQRLVFLEILKKHQARLEKRTGWRSARALAQKHQAIIAELLSADAVGKIFSEAEMLDKKYHEIENRFHSTSSQVNKWSSHCLTLPEQERSMLLKSSRNEMECYYIFANGTANTQRLYILENVSTTQGVRARFAMYKYPIDYRVTVTDFLEFEHYLEPITRITERTGERFNLEILPEGTLLKRDYENRLHHRLSVVMDGKRALIQPGAPLEKSL